MIHNDSQEIVSDMFDLVSFLSEIGAVGIGVFLGFLADSYLESRVEKAQKIRVLKILLAEFRANIVAMNIIRTGIENRLAPYAHFTLNMWDAVSNKIDLITNDELLNDIAAAYYNFRTFEKTFDLFLTDLESFLATSDEMARTRLERVIEQHRLTMLDRLREPRDDQDTTIVFRTNKAINGIEQELKRLDC